VARSRARERELARRRYERRRLREQQLRARRRRRNTIIGAVLGTLAVIGGVVALVVSLVGGSSDNATVAAKTSQTPGPTPTPTQSSAAPTAPTTCGPISPNPPAKGEPTVPPVTGKAPTTLVSKDIKKGHGAAVKSGQTLTVNYVGVSCSTGKVFDASFPRKQPFSFPLGQGQVIKGWDQGLVGMRVGGERELVIPAALGYGPAGSGSIKGNETLIFVVDLVSAK
jgi:peptidylprolyl isomerase